MPPEQAEGRLDLVDERSDVYGLGAILYDILVGEPPFDGPDTGSVLTQVVADSPTPPRRKVPGTPRALDAVCLKALAKKAADRYASAKDLARDVQNWLADEPVSAYREPLLARTGRWGRQHRQLITAAAILLAASVVVSVVIAVNREQARRVTAAAEREALKQKELAQANEKAASEREAETQAVLIFVESNIFAAARPQGRDGGLGREVTLRRVTEAALPFIEQSFHDKPLLEARLRITLGRSFAFFFSDWKTALTQFQAARASTPRIAAAITPIPSRA